MLLQSWGRSVLFCFLSQFETVCIPASSPQISLSLWQLSCLLNRRFCQQGTDIKDRLLHNQCLKCDYNQMCMQIVSEAEDFAISHRYMLLGHSFMSCHQKESVRHRISAIWQEKKRCVALYRKISQGMVSADTMTHVYNKENDLKRL